jgi:hypothetical protein
VEAVWRINHVHSSFQTVDVTVRPFVADGNPHIAPSGAGFTDKPHRFLLDCVRLAVHQPRSFKLIFTTTDGFVGRGNLFERRLLECPVAERVEGFLALDQMTAALKLPASQSESFHTVVSSAAAGVLLASGEDVASFAVLEAELSARLSLNWIFPTPAPHRNVVLIEGYTYLQTGVLISSTPQHINQRMQARASYRQ